jgi:hypothetical protein
MKILFITVLTLLAGALFAGDASYVGATKCAKMCHKGAKKGEQLEIWQKSKHAEAYKTLATPAALETAKQAGVTGDPRKSDKCIKCHVTAFSVDAKLLEATYSNEEGVGCEACHGAGKNYAKLNIMKDKAKARAAGMIVPDEKVCVKCHNKESPNFKGFNFKEMYPKIAHPAPAKEAK